MLDVIQDFYFVFGALTLIGGIIGFLRAKSLPSLMAGLFCGLVLVAAGLLVVYGKVNVALILGILVSVALAGQFIPKVMLNRAPIQAILMAALSALGVVLTLIAFAKK